VEAKYDAGKFKPPEEIGLTLLHKTFAVFRYIENKLEKYLQLHHCNYHKDIRMLHPDLRFRSISVQSLLCSNRNASAKN